MRILVIGKNGQLARSIKKVFNDDSLIFSGKDDLNLEQSDLIKQTILNISPDIIINSSAYTNVDNAEKDFEIATLINEIASIEIAKASKELDVPLIHISTDYIFNGARQKKYTEMDETDPINKYGLSKLNGETGIISNCSKAIIIRTSWLFGCNGNNFLKTIFKKIYDSENIKIVNNQIGKPTSSISLAECLKEIIIIIKNQKKEFKNEIYHFANYPECSWYDFSVEIKKIMDKYIDSKTIIEPIDDAAFAQLAKRPNYSVLCSSKIENELNIKKNYWVDYLENDIESLIKNI
tara:strand:- start:1087 stop:1965 length:879 start_codon:yes stop_codon:yes gene_type:complete